MRRAKTREKTAAEFLAYLIAILVLLVLTFVQDSASTPHDSLHPGYLKIPSRDFWFEQVIGEPEPPARYVSVIILDTDVPPTIGGATLPGHKEISVACKRRIYIAQLLRALLKFAPKVVVLDMWFESNYCSYLESQVLWDELDQFSSQIPIVSGLASYNPSELRSSWPAEFADARNHNPPLKPTELVLKPGIAPIHMLSANITEGVVELNSDYLKLPLSWPVYENFVSVGQPGEPRRVDSLSVAAVRAFDSRSLILGRIDALNPDGSSKVSIQSHPFTSFLREEDLPIARAIEIVCSGPLEDSWQIDCNLVRRRTHDDLRKSLEGKIVLVGRGDDKEDVHQSLLGDVPGVVLQANFIESLLQNRVYKPISKWSQSAIGLAWLALIFWVPWEFSSERALALLLSLLSVIIPAYLIQMFFLHFHYYVDLLFPMIAAAFVLNIVKWIERFLTRHEEKT
jgi:hypothetical protein